MTEALTIDDARTLTLRRRGIMALIVILAVIVCDQALKIWVKTHFYLGEEVGILSWFRLLFVENNGMAFGMELGSKLFLTLLRIALVIVLVWYVYRIAPLPAVKTGYLVCLALIIAGAAGNIIDCVFYGRIFNDPVPPGVAEIFPPDPYGSWLHGKVVDMLYFPLFEFDFPQWVPWVGGEHFLFFQPVFNLADSAITVGILMLIFFYSSQIASPKKFEEMSLEEAAGDDFKPLETEKEP